MSRSRWLVAFVSALGVASCGNSVAGVDPAPDGAAGSAGADASTGGSAGSAGTAGTAGTGGSTDSGSDADPPDAADGGTIIPSPTCLAEPIDAFDGASVDLTRWEVYGAANLTVEIDQGQLLVEMPESVASAVYGGVEGLNATDLQQCDVVVQVSAAVVGSPLSYTVFGVSPPEMILDYFELYMLVLDSTLTVGQFEGNLDTVLGSVPYDPKLHTWWRIGMHAGKVHFMVSETGKAWTSIASIAAGPKFSSVVPFMGGGVTGAGTGTQGASRFDNANLPPP